MSDDVFDELRPAGSRWTRVNIGEAIPGVPTPLAWSIWQPAMQHAFWWSQVQLGVASKTEYGRAPITTLALGHPAISVDVTLDQVGRLPGYDADAFAEQYFGLPRPASPSHVRTDPRVLARVAARAPAALATLGRRVQRTSATAESVWTASVFAEPPPADSIGLLAAAAAGFTHAMAVHTLQGVLCQGAYERVAALRPDLAGRLVSGDGDLAEAAVANDLWALAHGSLTEAVFVARHGFHGPNEGELASPSWREDPAPVRATARAWASADDHHSPVAAAARRTRDRRRAERELLEAMPRWRRPAARALVAATRRLVMQRELGKASFLRHLDIARFAARAIGPDAVWCTLAELRTARPSSTVLDERRARRGALAALDLPVSWSGDPQPVTRSDRVAGREVRGLGVSPGVVEGRARVVTDPALLVEPLAPDEVLVARTTDPSWVTVFLTAGALVIDVGGALSHGAIIARELGIPCVIGTGDGTRQIPDGAHVKVDGTTGTIEVTNC